MRSIFLGFKHLVSFFLILLINISLLSCITMLFVSCGSKKDKAYTEKIIIVTTLFPLYDFARHIGQDRVEVILLLPPGVEPHGFEPKPGDIAKIKKSRLFIYTGDVMEPWVRTILKSIDKEGPFILVASEGIKMAPDEAGHGHRENLDPHIWLDFTNATIMLDNILNGMVTVDGQNKGYYTENWRRYREKLEGLDKRFKEELTPCKKRVFIHSGHAAYGYLAKRYNLTYISGYGGAPDGEPTPKTLITLKNLLKQHGLKTIFYEEFLTPRVASIISEETGAEILKLHPCGNITKDEMDRGITFLELMEENLKNLKKGLQCG
ncbi:MAG: zinc ABC transporter substrate-binding protein [Syntrophorhabdaceae bacterium]|nr:zinc ABC transporter substrate-binding protein [Syntrophorhabdaceae bacterium]